MAKELIAYCMKTKKKESMLKAVIKKNSKGRFAAEGETKDGNKMFLFLSEANALAAVKDGVAKKGW
jgi:molybdopterin biosynthesis enzyme